MKALLVVPWEDVGGVVTAAENLASYLQARGHEVVLFHPGPSVLLKRRATKRGFSGITLRLCFPFAQPRPLVSALAFPVLFPIVLLQLLWFLRRHRFQIVNVHYPNNRYFYFAICARLLSIQLVTSLHGGDAFKNGKPKDRPTRAFRFILQASHLIVLPSATYRKRLLEAFPGMESKTIFIHNGVNPAKFISPGKRQDKIVRDRSILCIAHLRDYKGIDVLLHAAKPLLAGDPSLRLILAGDGPLREELEYLAFSLGIGNQTRFLGTIGPEEIASQLYRCEVLVLPSREESFGIAILEAMVCRKPVVATAVGGIPEIIEHEISGILVEPENPQALAEGLLRVLTDNALRKSIAENGYLRVLEHFSSSHTGAAYEKAFTSLLGVERTASHLPSKVSDTQPH